MHPISGVDMEKRIYPIHLEVREPSDGQPAMLTGYAAVFNSLSENLGGFVETIEPGAFRDTLSNNPDVRATIDHEAGLKVLGRTKNGTLTLTEDENGLRVAIEPPDTQAGRDALILVRRGDLSQMSFAFTVPPGGDTWGVKENGLPLRRLRAINLNGGDVSIVTNPAYPETSIEARDMGMALANKPTSARARTKGRGRLIEIERLRQ